VTATFTVDDAGPQISFDDPTADGVVDGNGFSVNASFDEIASWQLWADETSLVASSVIPWTTASASYSPGWADGSVHKLGLTATDLRGNSSYDEIWVTADSAGPVVTLDSPAQPAVFGASATVSGTVTDSVSDIDSGTLILYREYEDYPCNSYVGETTVSLTPGAWSATFDTSGLEEGVEYCFLAGAYDTVGNWGATDYWTFTVDHAAPGKVTLDSPSSGSSRALSSVTFNWLAPVGDAVKYEFEVGKNPTLVDGKLPGAVTASDLAALKKVVSGLANGTWYWHVRALDAAGNAGEWSELWTLSIDVPAPPKAPAKPPVLGTTGNEPTDEPTTEPTAEPTEEPTDEPTEEPSDEPTDEPTEEAAPTDTAAGFPIVWVFVGIGALLIAGLAFLIRFLMLRRG
jgi:hypothetical protein